MNTKHKILGLITARGGSKGVPGKNIKPLAGKPLIAYTIESAQKSGVFDRLILSTDDPEIANVAKEYGCEVPFIRPKELAEDTTEHLPVLRHAVMWLKENEGYNPDYTMTLQPTSPLRQPFHIKEAVDLIIKTGADSILGVSEIPGHFSPYKAMTIDDKGMLSLFSGRPIKERTSRRQNLAATYASNGIIYLYKTKNLFDDSDNAFFGKSVLAYPIDTKYNVDIDTREDWEGAEQAIKKIDNKYN